MAGGLACSASADKSQDDEIAAVLKDIPEGTIHKFILTVSTDKDGKVNAQYVSSVLSALREGGAETVESLEDTPVIFATCDTAAIYKALDTGLLKSVQVDRLSKPQ